MTDHERVMSQDGTVSVPVPVTSVSVALRDDPPIVEVVKSLTDWVGLV